MPGDDIVYVDQRAVSHENLQHDNTHRIYFAPGTSRERHRSRYAVKAKRPAAPATRAARSQRARRDWPQVDGDLVINASKSQGTVYIYDEDNRNVIYTADLDHGNSLKLDVSKGIIYVNSKKYAEVKVPHGHTLSLYMSGH